MALPKVPTGLGAGSRVRVGCLSVVLSGAVSAGRTGELRAHSACLRFHPTDHRETTAMHTNAPAGREERRAELERRRAAVAQQMRRLAIELAELDRQLDEIEQSER